ncbi:MAG: hypothetical protein K0R87_3207 [Pseudonocardia sp.]|nr:hypothetical protein [Pseudonocardia sp.]
MHALGPHRVRDGRERCLDGIASPVVGVGPKMSVGVERDPRRGVPEPALHHLDRLAVVNEERCVGKCRNACSPVRSGSPAARAAGRQICDHIEGLIGWPRSLVNTRAAGRVVGFRGSIRSSMAAGRGGYAARCAAIASSVHCASGTTRPDSDLHPARCSGSGERLTSCCRTATDRPRRKSNASSSSPNTSACRSPDPITRSTAARKRDGRCSRSTATVARSGMNTSGLRADRGRTPSAGLVAISRSRTAARNTAET